MNMNVRLLTALTGLALFAGAGVALAAEGTSPSDTQGGGRPPMMGQHPEGPHGPGMRASTTWQGGMGSTSWNGGAPGMHGSTTDMMRGPGFRGVPGTVTEVDADHFLMNSRGFGKDAATTTLTVNITSATKFRHGSTTASLADLSVGTRVEVLGKVATSTKTITADAVVFGMQGGAGMHPEDRGDASSTEQHSRGGFLNTLRNFFSGSHGGTDASSGGPAAAGSGDFLGSVLSSLFGWMH